MEVRLAELADGNDILSWRNDGITRSMSFNGWKVDRKSHKDWYDRVLRNPNRILVIGCDGARKVGVVRFDNEVGGIEISINLNPKARRRGLATALLVAAEDLLNLNWGQSFLVAEIKNKNIASIKTFKRAGYKFSGPIQKQGDEVGTYKKMINSEAGPKL